MSNMSYCRFQNTVRDLNECHEALEGLFSGEGKLSEDELSAAKRLAETCCDVAKLIVENLDRESFDDLMDSPYTERKIAEVLDSANDDAEEERA